MKPVEHNVRPKEWIPLTNYAIVSGVPDELKLLDHMVPFEGSAIEPKFFWGLYGTASSNYVLFLADAFASSKKKQVLTVHVRYLVDNFDRVRSKITEEIATEAGFLHLDRVQTDFRDDLRKLVHDYLAERLTTKAIKALEGLSLDDIVMRHPQGVFAIFDKFKKINVVVHPVLQTFDRKDKKPVYVATVRNIKSRVMSATVRYLEDSVKVVV